MVRVLIPAIAARPVRPAGPIVRAEGASMGTRWSALACGPGLDARAVARAVQGALDRVVAQMSPWEPASDLSRFNKAAPGWHDLPQPLMTVLAHGLALAEDTGGAFDPAIGALVDLWGFGRVPSATPPDEAAITDALAAGGWRRLRLDPAASRAFQPGGLRLDLSGIAKGFGVDRAADALAALGADAWLVEVGGELSGHGVRPDGQPWWVALESDPAAGAAPTRLALHGQAVATSGDYIRCFEHDGRRYGHTLDPRTGRPLGHGLLSVSVVAKTALAADALATALLVLGPQAGPAYAERRRVAALFALEGGAEHLSSALAAMLD